MLVLTRKLGEKIVINDQVTLTVKRISGGRVTLAFEAPADIRILRQELRPFPTGFSKARYTDDCEPEVLCGPARRATWPRRTAAK